jgi:hypothetical protein
MTINKKALEIAIRNCDTLDGADVRAVITVYLNALEPVRDDELVKQVYNVITPMIATHDSTYAGCKDISEAATETVLQALRSRGIIVGKV